MIPANKAGTNLGIALAYKRSLAPRLDFGLYLGLTIL
jgi:hypothetical protein